MDYKSALFLNVAYAILGLIYGVFMLYRAFFIKSKNLNKDITMLFKFSSIIYMIFTILLVIFTIKMFVIGE